MASYMYTEQVGSNRHIEGSSGETYRLYPRSSASVKAFTPALPVRCPSCRHRYAPAPLSPRQAFLAAARNSSRSTPYPAPAQPCLAFKIKSTLSGISACDLRKTSRNRRLTRFRTTAFPTFRETVIPRRWWPSPFCLLKSTNHRVCVLRPSLYMERYSAPRTIRRCRGNRSG